MVGSQLHTPKNGHKKDMCSKEIRSLHTQSFVNYSRLNSQDWRKGGGGGGGGNTTFL